MDSFKENTYRSLALMWYPSYLKIKWGLSLWRAGMALGGGRGCRFICSQVGLAPGQCIPDVLPRSWVVFLKDGAALRAEHLIDKLSKSVADPDFNFGWGIASILSHFSPNSLLIAIQILWALRNGEGLRPLALLPCIRHWFKMISNPIRPRNRIGHGIGV